MATMTYWAMSYQVSHYSVEYSGFLIFYLHRSVSDDKRVVLLLLTDLYMSNFVNNNKFKI